MKEANTWQLVFLGIPMLTLPLIINCCDGATAGGVVRCVVQGHSI